jgi:hypothetical protein
MSHARRARHDPQSAEFVEFCALRRQFEELRAAHATMQRASFDSNEHDEHRTRLRALNERIRAFRETRKTI